jgi:prepilin-type N-terminal cleavage/methylation domain-containing protein
LSGDPAIAGRQLGKPYNLFTDSEHRIDANPTRGERQKMTARITLDRTTDRRQGFTLIEVLTVIIIISILAALLIPAIGGAVRRAKTAAMRMEVEGLSQAIEAYNSKYGDYPPDFSDWDVVRRHYRKIFPNINQEELLLLLSMCTTDGSVNPARYSPTRMDRAEALVWSLGGFSSDPERPFTGKGGPIEFYVEPFRPLSFTGNPQPRTLCQYNSDRDNSLFDFQLEKLGLYLDADRAVQMDNRVMSTDDPSQMGSRPFGDWFPVYRSSPDFLPFVYFDSRTYDQLTGSGFNGYAAAEPAEQPGSFVRPYYSDQPNPKTGTAAYGSIGAALQGWKFANPKTFQIIGPGLDGKYGSLGEVTVGSTNYPLYFQYPTGLGVIPLESATAPGGLRLGTINGFIESGYNPSIVDNFQLDNVSNFSSGTMEDDVVEE